MYFVYCIECFTPNHLYVGKTRRLEVRITEHRTGHGTRFTLRHGVSKWCIAATTEDPTKIDDLEVTEYKRLRALGYVVGGHSTLDGVPAGYAAGEFLPNGYLTLESITKVKDKLSPAYITHAPRMQELLDDTSFVSIRAKARELGRTGNISEEAAMSMLRRFIKSKQ